MLEKQTFKDGIEKLLAVFPVWNIKNDDPKAMKVWYSFFESYGNKDFETMIQRYIKKDSRYPTVKTMLEHMPGEKRTGVPEYSEEWM